jgi:hypothetical protein
MAGKLSPAAHQKLATLNEFQTRVLRVHGLVEQFATARADHEGLAMSIRRAFQQLKIQFMGAGFDAQSQLCGAMEMAAGRGGSPAARSRILREGVGQLRFQIELEQRAVVSEDADRQRAAGGPQAQEPETPGG